MVSYLALHPKSAVAEFSLEALKVEFLFSAFALIPKFSVSIQFLRVFDS